MSESQIQSKCILWFSQTYPERRGDVFATFQETINKIQGGQRNSMGLVAGVSDIIYINSLKNIIGIEMKAPKTYHDTVHVLEQCRFILNNAHSGWFCISLESFQKIIESDGEFSGIDPIDVVEICREKIESKIKLSGKEDLDDLIFECNKYYDKTKKKIPQIKF